MKKLKSIISDSLTLLCPKLCDSLKYIHNYHKLPNLKQPKTFSEKLLWLKFNTYRNNRQIMQLIDKYSVREYIVACGLKGLLNELYFVTDDANSIKYEDLPDTFVLKRSQGCGANIICASKSDMPEDLFMRELNELKSGNLVYDTDIARVGGVGRKKVPVYYICEKFLNGTNNAIPADYKIYCFNGVPKAILFIDGRFEEGKSIGCFMTTDWTFISVANDRYVVGKIPEKPKSLEVMLRAAEKLSAPFPFVRVDFYDIDGKAVFGEMTFFPNGCIGTSETQIEGKSMGEWLSLDID